jgi:transcriptional regulator with XRE-family HTH domain
MRHNDVVAKHIGEYLAEQRRAAQLSLRQLAREAGVSNPYLSQIERGLRRPSADVLQRLASALQISSEALYVRAGLLDDASEASRPDVLAAIQADERLTPLQRRALAEVYRAFVSDSERSTTAAAAAAAATAPGTRSASAPNPDPTPHDTVHHTEHH